MKIEEVTGFSARWIASGTGERRCDGTNPVQHDPLARRRENILEDVADMIARYNTADDLRRASAKLTYLLDADWRELTAAPTPVAPDDQSAAAPTRRSPAHR